MYILALCLLLACPLSWALHLQGTWHSSNRYLLLAKFGIQKTEMGEERDSRGYIYGNITTHQTLMDKQPAPVTLVVVDGDYVLDLYGNGTSVLGSDVAWAEPSLLTPPVGGQVETNRCRAMFAKIDKLAWHPVCNPSGKVDFLRSVPCVNSYCREEDDPARVIKGAQFTYTIQDVMQPRYWYVSLVACWRNESSCEWESTSVHSASPQSGPYQSLTPLQLSYDIWLVNGAPNLQRYNRFEHQFSFDDHDTMEIFLVFTLLYIGLAGFVQVQFANANQPTSLLLSFHLWLEVVGSALICVHLVVFSSNGVGVSWVDTGGDLIRRWADCFFLVLLVLLAERGVHAKPPWAYLIVLVVGFVAVATGFYWWALMDHDPVLDMGVWDTVPGCLLLASRISVAFWFLASLRSVGGNEIAPGIDLLHFSAGYLLWFLTLPLTVLIAEIGVSSLWRKKTVLSVTYCCDFVAASVMVYIIWKSRHYPRPLI